MVRLESAIPLPHILDSLSLAGFNHSSIFMCHNNIIILPSQALSLFPCDPPSCNHLHYCCDLSLAIALSHPSLLLPLPSLLLYLNSPSLSPSLSLFSLFYLFIAISNLSILSQSGAFLSFVLSFTPISFSLFLFFIN